MSWITHCPDPPGWIVRLDLMSIPSESGCLVWQGARDHSGYGKFSAKIDGRRTFTGAHRAAWLARRGDIPDLLVIDHLCRNRACVNVHHMELVTASVNTLRSDHSNKKGRSGKPAGALLHSCARHGQNDGYLYTARSGYTRWTCRICALERSRRHKEKARRNK